MNIRGDYAPTRCACWRSSVAARVCECVFGSLLKALTETPRYTTDQKVMVWGLKSPNYLLIRIQLIVQMCYAKGIFCGVKWICEGETNPIWDKEERIVEKNCIHGIHEPHLLSVFAVWVFSPHFISCVTETERTKCNIKAWSCGIRYLIEGQKLQYRIMRVRVKIKDHRMCITSSCNNCLLWLFPCFQL